MQEKNVATFTIARTMSANLKRKYCNEKRRTVQSKVNIVTMKAPLQGKQLQIKKIKLQLTWKLI